MVLTVEMALIVAEESLPGIEPRDVHPLPITDDEDCEGGDGDSEESPGELWHAEEAELWRSDSEESPGELEKAEEERDGVDATGERHHGASSSSGGHGDKSSWPRPQRDRVLRELRALRDTWDEQLYASGPVSVAVEAYTWHESKRELARKVHARHGNGEGHRPRSRSPAGPVVQRAVDTARVEPGGAETGGAETGGAETGGAAVRIPPPPPPPPAETRLRCSAGHPLVPFLAPGQQFQIRRVCDRCSRDVSVHQGGELHGRRACDYDLCSECVRGASSGTGRCGLMAKAPPSRRRHHLMWSRHWCPAGHALVRDRAPVDGSWCDRCSATVNRGGVLHGCRRCNFDLCGQCGGGSQEASRMVRVPLRDPLAVPPPPPPPPPPLFTFLTVIDKQGFENWRMLVEECDQPAPGHPEGFKILAFYSDGALAAHNNQQGAVRIDAGDVIMSVNGTSDRGDMLQELVQSRVCRLSIIRPFNSLEAPAPHAMTSLLRQRLRQSDSEANSEEPEVRDEGGRDWFI